MKINNRIFIPGDQWLYFKIYTNEKNAEKILHEELGAIIKKLDQEKKISNWFFIRYADPDFHLRIRILLKDSLDIVRVMEVFNLKIEKYIKNKSVHKVQLDTYVRELERYGKYTTDLAESLFSIDSNYTLKILKDINKNKNENYRWLSALLMIDELFNSFKYDINKKKEIISQMSDSYKAEFGFNYYNSKQFNVKFRENKKIIEQIFKSTPGIVFFSGLKLLLAKKKRHMEPLVADLFSFHEKKAINVDTLLPSYIHMMLNRLFISSARLYELLIYDFLRRIYESELARLKYKEVY